VEVLSEPNRVDWGLEFYALPGYLRPILYTNLAHIDFCRNNSLENYKTTLMCVFVLQVGSSDPIGSEKQAGLLCIGV
jgi:hypothetical protein